MSRKQEGLAGSSESVSVLATVMPMTDFGQGGRTLALLIALGSLYVVALGRAWLMGRGEGRRGMAAAG